MWTRMHDGSYHMVKRTFGLTFSYTVRRTYAGRGQKSSVWTLHINDQYAPNEDGPAGCTCKGAKDRAVRHFCRMAALTLAASR